MVHCVCGHWFNMNRPVSPWSPPAKPAAPRSANTLACPSCANQVSRNAVSCPQCGHVFKQSGGINLSDPVHVVGLIVCVIILLLAAYWIYGKLVGF